MRVGKVRKMPNKISTYKEFWPYYLGEHSNPICRWLHYGGTTLALITFTLLLITKSPIYIPIVLICGYGPAWAGHFFIEKNRPATFDYPMWSLISDFRMYLMWLSGNLGKELKLYSVKY